jgi:exonuclease SbcC
MRPHRLRVQAFGAFADTEQVCFDDLAGLFLLHGETGAGKTTLLDAIAFALYGRVPGVRGKTKRLRSDHAAASVPTEVELETTIGGRRLRITRKPEQERPKRSGTGMTTEPASVRLEESAATGTWEVKSTRVGEADAEIRDLLGMSAEQFFQVVLLPQGQFAQFLHADADARARLLQRLFGTDRFRAVEDWLADHRRTTAAEVEDASKAVDHLLARIAQAAGVVTPEAAPPDAAAHTRLQAAWAAGLAASATAARDQATALVASGERDLDAALAAKGQAEQLADRQRRRRDALRAQSELDAASAAITLLRAEAEAAARAAEVAPVLDETDRAAAAAQAARGAEEQARAEIPDAPVTPDADGPEGSHHTGQGRLRDAEPTVLRAAAAEQRAHVGRLGALRAVAQQAADEDESAAAARVRGTQLDAALGQAQAEAACREDARPQAAQARDAASQAAADLPAARAAADTARHVATDAAALVKARAKRDRLHVAHLAAREKAVGLREEASRLRQARIDGMRAELAAALVDGAPCPVCGSLEHPELCELPGELVSREQEEAAYAVADDAAAAADKAGRQVAAADAVIDDLTQRLAEAGFAVPEDAAALTAAATQAEADAKRLDTEAAGLATTAASLGDRQRVLDALDEAIADDKAKLTELVEQRNAALAEAEAATQRAAERRAELRAQLGTAPDLDTALQAVRQLAEALTAAADAADVAERTAAQAREASDRASRAATDAGFAGMSSGLDAIDTARAAFRQTHWRDETADRISRHDTESKTVATLLTDPDLDVELDPPAPVAETAEAATTAQQAHAAAADAHGRAQQTAEQLRLLQPQLDDALAALEPLTERADQARQLADLAAGLGANQYRMTLSSFVLAARLEEVAKAASERLLTMTAGRYSLVHTDARRGGGKAGLGLLACDAWTGVDRDTSTLSGGETFLASLALALGLADVVTAEAAGTPMEALFVDEGFGTLDEDTLDEVMNVLDGLREGGRIVGVVSHVAELRQRIPAQVHVRKGRHGSEVFVTLLARAERPGCSGWRSLAIRPSGSRSWLVADYTAVVIGGGWQGWEKRAGPSTTPTAARR